MRGGGDKEGKGERELVVKARGSVAADALLKLLQGAVLVTCFSFCFAPTSKFCLSDVEQVALVA